MRSLLLGGCLFLVACVSEPGPEETAALVLVDGEATGAPLAEAGAWTAVASTGTIDEADVAVVRLSASIADLAPAAAAAETVVLRYNVVATPGINTINDRLIARFRDNGTSARVTVTLRSFTLATGATSNLAVLDSNGFAAATSFQTQEVAFGGCAFTYDFASNAYSIEVTMSRTDASGTPALQLLQLGGFNLC
jgi:hypothetical protein